MQLDVQYKLNNNEKMKLYLRENSEWYKYLNRNSNNYKNFENKMKDIYKLRATDKINNVLDNIDLIGGVLDAFK